MGFRYRHDATPVAHAWQICAAAALTQREFFGTPRGLGLATATTSATFLPHCEHRIRSARAASVTERPAIRASASGSMCRDAPHGQVTRTMKSPEGVIELPDVRQHAHGRMV